MDNYNKGFDAGFDAGVATQESVHGYVLADLQETIARGQTGDLNPDGSWATTIRNAAPAAPSVAPVAIGTGGIGLASAGAAGALPLLPLAIGAVGVVAVGVVLFRIFDW